MHKRIYAVRNGKSVTVYLNGKQNYLECQEEDEAKEIMALAAVAKNGTDEEKEEAIKNLAIKLDPSYAIEYMNQNSDSPLQLVRNRFGDVYLKNTGIPIPKMIVDALLVLMQDNLPYQHLVNFWSLCLQNPDEAAREGLFNFLSTYNCPITDYGYFIGYKAVYFRGEKNRFLLEGLSRLMINRKISRLSMNNLFIYQDTDVKQLIPIEADDEAKAWDLMTKHTKEELETEARYEYCERCDEDEDEDEDVVTEYEQVPAEFIEKYINKEFEKRVEKYELVCTGDEIQTTISNLLENDEADSFTDCYTQKMDIRIGKPVSMPRSECDPNPNRTCSTGLHIGAPGYVKDFGGGQNKAIIACLVNPADVVAVPHDYSYMKMRTSKYYPYAVCELDPAGGVVEIDAQYFEEDYCDYEIKELEAMLDSYNDEFNGLSKEEALTLIEGRLTTLSSH